MNAKTIPLVTDHTDEGGDYVNIIPLNSENVAAAAANWGRLHVVPGEYAELLEKSGLIPESGRFETSVERTDVRINDAPTTWYMLTLGGELVWKIESDLPCSIDFCIGHAADESEDWADFHHSAQPIAIEYDEEIELEKFSDHISPFTHGNGEAGVYIDLVLTGELTVAEASKIADSLHRIATGIAEAAKTAAALTVTSSAEVTA